MEVVALINKRHYSHYLNSTIKGSKKLAPRSKFNSRDRAFPQLSNPQFNLRKLSLLLCARKNLINISENLPQALVARG
ncbi:MAG: hypothetical protein SW833_08695 [Cyanobacteriota bacterium]|nr:hypothetical protein [Cyanobacteriota bacterium]